MYIYTCADDFESMMTCIYDVWADKRGSQNVRLELDIYWAARAGVSPEMAFEKWKERIGLVHIKDVASAVEPVNLLEIIPEGTKLDMAAYGKYALLPDAFTEAGSGKLNLALMLSDMEKAGAVEHFVVEQDFTAIGEVQSARKSYQALKEL